MVLLSMYVHAESGSSPACPLFFTNQIRTLGASCGESPRSKIMRKVWYSGASAPESWVCNTVRPLTSSEMFAAEIVNGYKELLEKLNKGWHHPLEGVFNDMSVCALREKALTMIAKYEPMMRA